MAFNTYATYSIRNDRAKRTLYVRMQGTFDLQSMKAACDTLKVACDEYNGAPHFCVADLRGMAPAFSDIAQMLGEGIAYCRQHGVVCCAHLADHTVTRLQAGRLARAATVGDDATIDVVSEREAERVMEELRASAKYRVA